MGILANFLQGRKIVRRSRKHPGVGYRIRAFPRKSAGERFVRRSSKFFGGIRALDGFVARRNFSVGKRERSTFRIRSVRSRRLSKLFRPRPLFGIGHAGFLFSKLGNAAFIRVVPLGGKSAFADPHPRLFSRKPFFAGDLPHPEICGKKSCGGTCKFEISDFRVGFWPRRKVSDSAGFLGREFRGGGRRFKNGRAFPAFARKPLEDARGFRGCGPIRPRRFASFFRGKPFLRMEVDGEISGGK